MKKLFLIVAAMFAAVSFSACSDDDDNGGKAPTPEKWVKQIVFRAEWVTLSEISDKMAYPNFYIIPTNRAIA